MKKELNLLDHSPKENQKLLTKIEEMVDVCLNLANFKLHTLLTLAPHIIYTLNLQALIKVPKVS